MAAILLPGAICSTELTFTVERSFMDKTNKIAMEILNAKKRVDNRAGVKDMCDECKYNTGDYVCHHHCSGCDGRSKYQKGECGHEM
ncbi:MAG: hypothetical protein KHX45_24875 [Clostridiales bacterium]|nr:hypothetical protein [Clostridiales bacterium]